MVEGRIQPEERQNPFVAAPSNDEEASVRYLSLIVVRPSSREEEVLIIMGEEEIVETTTQGGGPLAAPFIFFIVIAFQLASWWLEDLKKKASRSATEYELRAEIKRLLKEASSYSQPSTFAQAAKLRRMAAAKEKELANYLEMHGKEIRLSYDMYLKNLLIAKIVIYFLLICWFWRTPVAAISHQLVQPFGKFLSWGGGSRSSNTVMVGIMPWLILSTRVSKFVCGLVVK